MEEPVRVPLDVQRYAATNHVTQEFLEMMPDGTKLEVLPEILGGLRIVMSRKIYSHHLASWVEETSVPKNWWQHLRMQLGLSHKDRKSFAKIDRYRTYPELPILPQRHVGISYLQEERTPWT